MAKHILPAGFEPPHNRPLGNEHRAAAFAQLLAMTALAISTLVVATIVSIGIARADVATNVIDNEGGLFAIALLLGLLFIGTTILSLPHHRHKRKHS